MSKIYSPIGRCSSLETFNPTTPNFENSLATPFTAVKLIQIYYKIMALFYKAIHYKYMYTIGIDMIGHGWAFALPSKLLVSSRSKQDFGQTNTPYLVYIPQSLIRTTRIFKK